jgi:hypothetical protein
MIFPRRVASPEYIPDYSFSQPIPPRSLDAQRLRRRRRVRGAPLPS